MTLSADILNKRAEAYAHGFAPSACNECGNYTLVVDGDIFKCDTCGKRQDAHGKTLPDAVLYAKLIGPAPHVGIGWHMQLDVPLEGRTLAVMNDQTEGIADLRRRLGGTLKIGSVVHIVEYKPIFELGNAAEIVVSKVA